VSPVPTGWVSRSHGDTTRGDERETQPVGTGDTQITDLTAPLSRGGRGGGFVRHDTVGKLVERLAGQGARDGREGDLDGPSDAVLGVGDCSADGGASLADVAGSESRSARTGTEGCDKKGVVGMGINVYMYVYTHIHTHTHTHTHVYIHVYI